MRKIFFALLFFALMLAPTILHSNEVTVTINGAPVNFVDQSPVIIDGRTFVPVRGVFEALGFVVDWQPDTQSAVLTNVNSTIVIPIGSDVFTTNGVSHVLDVPAQIIGGRTMLPIRAVLESVGHVVGWDDAHSVVWIINRGFERIYVRDDGVVFGVIRSAESNYFLSIGMHIEYYGYYERQFHSLRNWTWGQAWINNELQSNGFRYMDDSIWVWAFLNGPHPSQGQQFRLEAWPIWYYYSHYRNHNPRSAVTNLYFAATYENFIDALARPNASASFGQFWGGYDGWTGWPEINPQLDQWSRQAMQSGFAGDDIRHVFPFSIAFFDKHVTQTEFHFWIGQYGDLYVGFGSPGRMAVGIFSQEMTHAIIGAHELAHIFGLNEHLAHAFEEIMNGLKPGERAFPLYRESSMDRVLMDLAGYVAFWEAVFWSSERYEQLWQQHLGHFIPFETMQLARAGHQAVMHNCHLQYSFIVSTGHSGYNNLCHISHAFINTFDRSLSLAIRNHYARIAQQEINNIADWARLQDLEPYPSHLDIQMRIGVTPLNPAA